MIQIVDWYLKFDTSNQPRSYFTFQNNNLRCKNGKCCSLLFWKKTFHFLYWYLYNCFISLHAYICVHLSYVTLSLHLRWFTISVLLPRDKIDIYDDSTGWSWVRCQHLILFLLSHTCIFGLTLIFTVNIDVQSFIIPAV